MRRSRMPRHCPPARTFDCAITYLTGIDVAVALVEVDDPTQAKTHETND